MSQRLKKLVLSLTIPNSTVDLNEFIKIRAIYRLLTAMDGYVSSSKLDIYLAKLDELEASIFLTLQYQNQYSESILKSLPLRLAIKSIDKLPIFNAS